MILTLPWPPSVNRLWRAVKGRLIVSAEYRDWKELAATKILVQRRQANYKPLPKGPISIDIGVRCPDKRRRDLDNLIKPALAALVRARVIQDDSDVDELSIWRDKPVSGGQLRLRIIPLALIRGLATIAGPEHEALEDAGNGLA